MEKHKKSKKFNLKELIWVGFNFVCNIGFTTVFADMLISDNNNNVSQGVGIHLGWILAIDGIMATICAWAYCRMASAHKATNGGAYLYVRTGFNTYFGWTVIFMQYISMPIVITSQLVSMIRLNFVNSHTFLDTYNFFGNWSNLFWDSIGVILYIVIASCIFFGIYFIKKVLNWSSYIKWGSTIIIILFAIILFMINKSTGFKQNYGQSSINISKFANVFNSCFFFFLGCEGLATMSENVENPRKNMGKAIIIIMILCTIFYVSVFFIFFGAIIGNFSSNPNIQVFKEFGDKYASWVSVIGIILMLICTLSLKINSAIQITLYSGTMLEPVAKEGIMPEKYKNMDKDNIPREACKFTIFLTITILIIWLIIPDFIQAILNEKETVFQYSSLTGEVSLLLIIVYISVIITCLKQSFSKRISSNPFEIVLWILALIFLIFIFEEFFRERITSIAKYIKNNNNDTSDLIQLISATMQIILVFVIFSFTTIWYHCYYKNKYKKRMIENPELQHTLDSDFVIIPEEDTISNVDPLNV